MRLSVFMSILMALIVLGGCASLKEKAKCIAGVSTKDLEIGRTNALVQSFAYDYNTCYNKVREALIKNDAYIYAKKQDLIAIYVTAQDTTPVGLFFKKIDAGSTQVEVSSPSTYAKEQIAAKVFAALLAKAEEEGSAQ